MIGGLVARHTLLRERPNRVDDGHGGLEDDWIGVDAVPLPGWAIDAGATAADTVNREGSLIQFTARGPIGADVRAGDRITFDGERYAIDGAPAKQPGPSSRTSHMLLLLKRWEG